MVPTSYRLQSMATPKSLIKKKDLRCQNSKHPKVIIENMFILARILVKEAKTKKF